MHTKILAALVACLIAVAPATAGEIKGTGEYIDHRKQRGASECKYSGLNDGYFDGSEPERVQSFGQLVRRGFKVFLPSPGEACNPS